MSPLRWILVALVVTGATLSPGLAAPVPPPLPAGVAPPPVPPPPNLVYIVADDLDLATFAAVPEFRPLLQDQGVELTQAVVSLSLCCPSRVSTLRGQYAHNTGIYWNRGGSGGWHAFRDGGGEASALPVWLRAAGYTTALLGKYLNGYPGRGATRVVPPGWSHWYAPVAGDPFGGFGYTVNDDGRLRRFGSRPEDHVTDVLTAEARRWIGAQATVPGPFFLYLAPFGPHAPSVPPPRYAEAYADARVPRTAAFDEADVSDKPSWVRGRARIDAEEAAGIDARYRQRLRSTRGLVDLVAGVVDALAASGELDRTWIVFTSDNGFHQGEHRQRPGKNTGYDTDLRVPLVVRGPGVPRGTRDAHLVVNVDLAPTFAALAGATVPVPPDGRSLVPLLLGSPPPTWRSAVLLEHGGAPRDVGRADPLPEPADPDDAEPRGVVPAFLGLRTERWAWLAYEGGERELYDLLADPLQLENLAARPPPGVVEGLERQLAALAGCAGPTCRTAEEATW